MRLRSWMLPAPSEQLRSTTPSRRRPAALLIAGLIAGLLVSSAGSAMATPDRWGDLVPPAASMQVSPQQRTVQPVAAARDAEPAVMRLADEPEAANQRDKPSAEEPAAEDEPAAKPATPQRFAMAGGVDLYIREDVKLLGFHESGAAGAFPMVPTGTLRENLNTRYAPPESREGPDYLVLPTRWRRPGGTTAVDIAKPLDAPIVSPTTGTVTMAQPYLLYGRTPDLMLEIAPDGAPHARVRIVHLDRMPVTEGDRVEAGKTVIARSARQLPFVSQIDRFAGYGPHYHVEVRDITRGRR